MKKKHLIVSLSCVLLLVIIIMGVFAISANIQLSWHVIGGGGGIVQSGDGHMQHTIGQTVTGGAFGGTYQLGSGYWPGIVRAVPRPKESYLFLPMITAK